MTLSRRCTRVEETRKARANLPNEHVGFLQANRDESSSVWRKTASSYRLLVIFKNVKPDSSLHIVHDHSSFARTDSKSLRSHVETHSWVTWFISWGGGGTEMKTLFEQKGFLKMDSRFDDVADNFSCCVQDQLPIRSGIWI